MTKATTAPLRHPFPLHRVTPAGVDTVVEADDAERTALAAALDLPAIHRLVAHYRVAGSRDRVTVKGLVEAEIEQVCTVSLDDFPSSVREEVDLVYAAPSEKGEPAEVELSLDHDLPEELTGDTIDLGAVTAEHLALGLDPYPRKPGVAFDRPDDAPTESPFATLAGLGIGATKSEK